MGELIGGLIQMNSHMELTYIAKVLIVVGTLVNVACVIAWICNGKRDRKFATCMIACAVIATIAVIVGRGLPREQIIRACADGQVSLEQVAGRYDILEIDGKELTLRVR